VYFISAAQAMAAGANESGVIDALTDAGRLAAEGKLTAALAVYDRLIESNPSLAEAQFNRSIVLQRQGRFDDAANGFRAALQLRPRWTEALLALGRLAFLACHYREAEIWFQRAVDVAPDSVEAICNLGIAQSRQMHPARALPALQRARRLAPQHEVPWYELRRALNMLGRVDEAHRDFLDYERTAVPSARVACTGLATARRVAGDELERRYLSMALNWNYTANDLEALSDLLGILPYYDVPAQTVLALYETYDRLAQIGRAGIDDLALPPDDPGGRLRIGFLSADLRTHVMGRIIEEVVARHDAEQFEIHLYSLMPIGGDDALTARLRQQASGFTPLCGLNDYDAARRIADDRLHILVDLMGHTTWAQPGILVWKPAPVIVTHLGYHGAIGLRQVDFKITDAIADLPDAGDFQLECPLPMAGSIIPLRRSENIQPTKRIAGSPIVFGAFVGPQKMSPRCLSAWARILDQVPDAKLVFSPQDATEQAIYRLRAQSFGIDPQRIEFLPMTLDDAQDRGRYAALDVALDAFPYTGGDSAACALAEGVPFVTLCGRRHAERVATSVLTHLGVTDTIARSEDEYVEIAVRLAQDRDWREQVVARIRAALPDHDAAMTAYTRSLEAALREAWRRHASATAIPTSSR
jgi:predicted O-linked N-acetylglucosamine transferase (SPINDLY family)